MSVDPRALEVTSPCPVDLDAEGMRGPGRSWHCGHCDKAVHVLSAMTEREVQTFLRENAGKDVCVSYARTADGRIRFAPEPAATPAIVPVASLSRRRSGRAPAIGLGLALAACAPHDNPRVTPRPTAQLDRLPAPTAAPSIPLAPPPPAAFDDTQMDGEIRIAPPVQVEGGLKLPDAADEPCEPPAVEAAKPKAELERKPMAVRGRLPRVRM